MSPSERRVSIAAVLKDTLLIKGGSGNEDDLFKAIFSNWFGRCREVAPTCDSSSSLLATLIIDYCYFYLLDKVSVASHVIAKIQNKTSWTRERMDLLIKSQYEIFVRSVWYRS